MARAMGGVVVTDLDRAEVGSVEMTLTAAGKEDPLLAAFRAVSSPNWATRILSSICLPMQRYWRRLSELRIRPFVFKVSPSTAHSFTPN